MHDDPKNPQNANNTTTDAAPEPPQEPGESSTIISFLEHLARRQPYQPRTQSAQKSSTNAEHFSENEVIDAPETPEQKWLEHDPSPDQTSPWQGQVVSLEEIRRLRQHAADANLPTNPLLRYLFEHLMPNYQGGPVNLNVQPEFLQEHARPLLSLLLQSVADSLDGKRKTPPTPASETPPTEPPSQPAQVPIQTVESSHTDSADQAASAPPSPETPIPPPPTDTTQTPETNTDGVILKKNVSFSLDLSKIFKQFFSGDKNNPSK